MESYFLHTFDFESVTQMKKNGTKKEDDQSPSFIKAV
jgi:hypothetical protein